jgi:hypothetical protein
MAVITAPSAADIAVQEGEVARLRAELGQVQQRAQQTIQAAQERLSEAQGRLDGERLQLIADAAGKWRAHAAQLREDAARAGDETVVVTQHVVRPGLVDSRVPELRFKATELEAEAAQADAKAALCETWLTWFGSDSEALDSEALGQRVATLEYPPI